MNYIFSLHHKSENTEDLKGDISFSKYRLSSPSSSKKKQLKEKDKKKFKGDPKKSSGRLHQERCVHCHELFSEVSNIIFTQQDRGSNRVDTFSEREFSRVVPLLPGPDQAGDRVRVLPGLRQVSSLPLSLRGGKLHRYSVADGQNYRVTNKCK